MVNVVTVLFALWYGSSSSFTYCASNRHKAWNVSANAEHYREVHETLHQDKLANSGTNAESNAVHVSFRHVCESLIWAAQLPALPNGQVRKRPR